MPVFLDDCPFVASDLPAKPSVGQVVQAAKRGLVGSGRLIVGLRFDHEELVPERVEETLGRSVAEFQRVDLVSDAPRPIVLNALRQSRTAFGETFAVSKEAADELAAGRIGPAMQRLLECAGVWGQVHDAVTQGSALLEVDLETVQIHGRPILAWLGELAGRLRELRDAIEAHDYVLLVDILRYELDETLQGWEQMLDGLISHIEQMN